MVSELIASVKSIIKRLKVSHFVRNVAMVGGGIAIGHAIVLTFMPFLTRLYGPDAFGIAAAFAAIVNIIIPMATLGYASAIVMPEADADAAAVARLSILCGLIIAPVSLVAVYLGKPWIAAWSGMEKNPNMLYLIPVSLLVAAFLSVADQTAIRAHLFKAKAQAKIESTLFSNISKFIGGSVAPSGLLLIVLTLVEQVANFVMQMLRVPREGVLRPVNWFGFKGVRNAAASQRDFAIYRMPQNILNAASNGLPIILLTVLFSVSAAGQYSLAVMALGAPAMLLGQAIGEVFYPKITRAITSESLNAQNLLLKATLALFILGIIPFGVVFLWGDHLFPLVFGSDWELSGKYAQWIALWLLAVLTSGASASALPALGLQRFLLINEIISVCLRVGAFYVGFYVYHSDIVAIALFSIVNIIVNISIIYFSYKRLSVLVKGWRLFGYN